MSRILMKGESPVCVVPSNVEDGRMGNRQVIIDYLWYTVLEQDVGLPMG